MEDPNFAWLVVAIFVSVVAMGSVLVSRLLRTRLQPYFRKLLFGEIEVRIQSSFSLSDAERRLRDAIPRSMLSTPLSKAVVGTTSHGRLNVSVYSPLKGSSFAPRFEAQLVQAEGHTWIIGSFRLGKVERWFMTIWFAFVAFCACIAVPTGLFIVALGDVSGLLLAVGPLAMLAFGTGIVKLGQWMNRTDRGFITARVTEAVGGVVA